MSGERNEEKRKEDVLGERERDGEESVIDIEIQRHREEGERETEGWGGVVREDFAWAQGG